MACAGCESGGCGTGACGGSKPEKPSCRTCPHRVRCHGKQPDVTWDTVIKLVREELDEVLRERATRR